jgi:hypothetical protein
MPIEWDIGTQAPSSDEAIWRYMDLPKLISLLSTKALFFARSDFLGDPFEGSLPTATVQSREDEVRNRDPDGADDEIDSYRRWWSDARKTTAINSWYTSETESMAMWRLYGVVNEALAIRSSVARLFRALERAPERIFVGKVNYVHFDTAIIPWRNLLVPYFTKDVSFAHENEIRAVYSKDLATNEEDSSEEIDDQAGGVYIPIDLKELVQEIYVSPVSKPWFSAAATAAVSCFGHGFPIIQSRLGQPPRF